MGSFQLVDVKNIEPSVPRSNFLDRDIELLAQAILDGEGLLRPIILKSIGLEQYKVIGGDLEYYAAARAKEKDPRRGEMVNAFIISSKDEKTAIKQIEALAGVASKEVSEVDGKFNRPEIVNLELRITNLEARYETRLNELKMEQSRELQRIENELIGVRDQLPKKAQALDLFNNPKYIQELVSTLKAVGLGKNQAEIIAEEIQKESKKKPFDSLTDTLLRLKERGIKGLGEKRMLAIVDNCSRIAFL